MTGSVRQWKPWLPEAGFHFMTKDTAFFPWDSPLEEKMKALPTTPSPPSFKRFRGADTIRLTSRGTAGDVFFRTLRARRTHREFAKGKISLDDLSTLLEITWGVQGYFQTDVFGMLRYKTSPFRRFQASGRGLSNGAQGGWVEKGQLSLPGQGQPSGKTSRQGQPPQGQCVLRG